MIRDSNRHNNRGHNRSSVRWTMTALERRLLLAADAGAVVTPSPPTDVSVVLDANDATRVRGTISLVFVDPTVADVEDLIDGIDEAQEIVLLDRTDCGIDQITRALASHRRVQSIHIIAHGRSGCIDLGDATVDQATLVQRQEQIRRWSRSLTDTADILLYGCRTGEGDAGQAFIRRLAGLTGADVAASDDDTGSSELGGDWLLERSVGKVDSALAISQRARDHYQGVLPITIRAAGVTNEEMMQLQIDGQVVATYLNVGGDAYGNVFTTYTYNVDDIDPGQIRIAFTNDLYDQANGVDRNLRIDSISVDGITFQTESPSVFSTGTWLPADGLVAGFGRGEYLHANGYFQYADTSSGGTPIAIQASGSTGQESMSLQIDGVTVETWENVSTVGNTYNYTVSEVVTADRVRVAFINDLYDDANGIDRNLTVDFIQVGEQTLQSESSSVYSTGTWLAADGITPGYGRGETLHGNGYFQYAAAPVGNGSIVTVYAEGFEGDETIELQIDQIAVAQWTDIGLNQQAFTFAATGLVAADQVRVAFTNDLFDEATGTDRNVRVDRIDIDGVIYQTEDPTVYSTGTWTSDDGVVAGYGRGEMLHANGYFQYDAEPPAESGAFVLANSVINVDEAAGVAIVTINRTGGSDTPATIEYRSVSGSAVEGDDFVGVDDVLSFAIGETSRDVLITLVSDGVAEGTETFSFTIDNPTGAGILVPRTATITINDIELPQFADFNDVGQLILNGSAVGTGGVLRLTDTALNQAGTAFYDTAIPINADTSFQSQFTFRIAAGGGGNGADGMTFVVQGDPAGSLAIGQTGGGLGYAGINNSVAIEFDTYANADDVNDNHLSVLVNGNVATPIATKTYAVDLNGGADKYAWIDYNGTNNVLAVYLSETATKPTNPLLVTNVDLLGIVGSQAYAGFSAGTGGLANNHDLIDWSMNTEVPPIPNDPIPGSTPVAQTIATGFIKPTSIDFTAGGSIMYVAEQRGVVHVYQNGSDLGTLLDFSDRVNGTRDRGLLDIAVHPDLSNSPYLYLLYTYDPPEVNDQSAGSLAGPDGNGNRAGRLTRVTLDAATGYTSIVPGSEFILLGENSTWENFNGFANSTSNFSEPPAGILPDGTNLQDFIASDSESHTVGAVEFGPDGALYVSIGDGASYNQVDPRALRVLDIDNLSGKILRVDPITGDGLIDNPFYNNDPDANRSKVYQYGLRNPFRITVDDATGQVYVGDVGWTAWEEINGAGPGANYGWPFYEGATGTNVQTGGYKNLPEAAAFYANNNATPSILSLNHAADGINAIVLGDIYSGNQYPTEYQGDLFFNDLGQGIVRNVSFDTNGDIESVQTFATGANVVVQIVQGPDGFLYYVDLDDGVIGRWEFV
ncbi:MAG: DUF4347 domain-containing protein [Pirellulaceae bacterium]|nr:DUF4347 domain-containing protein [Pirellulaceae bacterium]